MALNSLVKTLESASSRITALNGNDIKSTAFLEALVDAVNLVAEGSAPEAVSASGAVSVLPEQVDTELSISGTKAYTMAAPTKTGQVKRIVCVSAASTPAGTLTVTSPDDTTGFVCASSFFFDTVGQTLVFKAVGSTPKWRCIQKIRTGRKALVVGTTATTGICNMSHIDLSVTATVASTGANALPNGSAVGEEVTITCSTAASTPHGDLGGTFLKKDGTAGTLLDDFTLVTDNAVLYWNGSAWVTKSLAGTTLSIA